MDEIAAVRKIWQNLDLPGIVDVHTHFMPKPVMDKVWQYFDAVGPLTGREWPIRYRSDEQERVTTLRRFGVRKFSALVYPHKPDMAAWLNQWATQFATLTPDCLHTATFYPEPAAADYVPAALTAGAQIFKVHIQVGDYDPNSPLLDNVWGALQDSQTPVLIHCGSGPVPGAHTGPEPIAALLAKYPRLILLIAHMGMPEYTEFLDLAARYPGVHLDTTMAFTDFANARMPLPDHELPRVRELGHKILFGSDFPNIPYGYCESLEAVVRLDLGDDFVRDVFYRNATRLFPVG